MLYMTTSAGLAQPCRPCEEGGNCKRGTPTRLHISQTERTTTHWTSQGLNYNLGVNQEAQGTFKGVLSNDNVNKDVHAIYELFSNRRYYFYLYGDDVCEFTITGAPINNVVVWT